MGSLRCLGQSSVLRISLLPGKERQHGCGAEMAGKDDRHDCFRQHVYALRAGPLIAMHSSFPRKVHFA
jgi:hypothetical protein